MAYNKTTSTFVKPASAPLKGSGAIDHLEYVDVTPVIGREYPHAKIKDILHAPNAKEQIRDLAITICERGVVFFRAEQTDLTVEEQKEFTLLLGELTDRPKDHGLHVHPQFRDPNNIPMGNGLTDPNIFVINTEATKKLYKTMKNNPHQSTEPRDGGREWHSDCQFEEYPADFSFLRMEETPPAGGDTVWCSGYELYDRISPPYRAFLESLTATCAQPVFRDGANAGGYEVMSPRGSPHNVGDAFSASHPVVRTHPVTGWKTIYAGTGLHVEKINGVFKYEDQMIRDYVMRLITRNHDCFARMHWTKQSVAIWSNPCTFHAATPDMHFVKGVRTGIRSTGIGEKPFLDPNSPSRRQALGLPLN